MRRGTKFSTKRWILSSSMIVFGMTLIDAPSATAEQQSYRETRATLPRAIRSASRHIGNRLALLPLAGLPISNVNAIVVDGQAYVDESLKTDTAKVLATACGKESKRGNSLCSEPMRAPAVASYEAAAKAFGVPASLLICLTKQESGFGAGKTSPTGAKGLTQFMPSTARHFQNTMLNSGPYQMAWENYRKLGGTRKDVRQFASSTIVSSDVANYDVQIFATAMYFRYYLNDTEAYWSDHREQTKNLYDYLMVSYNAGPARGQSYIRSGFQDARMPVETRRNYLPSIRACLEKSRVGR